MLESNKYLVRLIATMYLNLMFGFPFQTDFFSSKSNDKRNDFDFDIVNFPFLDGDVPHSTSDRLYKPQQHSI